MKNLVAYFLTHSANEFKKLDTNK